MSGTSVVNLGNMQRWIRDWPIPLALAALGAIGIADLCGFLPATDEGGTLVLCHPSCITWPLCLAYSSSSVP